MAPSTSILNGRAMRYPYDRAENRKLQDPLTFRLSLLLLGIFRFVSARYGTPLSLQLYFKT
jgi:hypothetical protein